MKQGAKEDQIKTSGWKSSAFDSSFSLSIDLSSS